MPGFVCGEAQDLEGVNGLKPFPLEKLHKTSLIVALKNAFPLAGRGLCFHFPCFSGFPQPFSHLHCLRKRQVEIVEFSAHHIQSYSRRRRRGKAHCLLPQVSQGKLSQVFLQGDCEWMSSNYSS